MCVCVCVHLTRTRTPIIQPYSCYKYSISKTDRRRGAKDRAKRRFIIQRQLNIARGMCDGMVVFDAKNMSYFGLCSAITTACKINCKFLFKLYVLQYM